MKLAEELDKAQGISGD